MFIMYITLCSNIYESSQILPKIVPVNIWQKFLEPHRYYTTTPMNTTTSTLRQEIE